MTTAPKDAWFGLSLRFAVKLDDHSLGGWATCSGLKVQFAVESVKEGGENGFVHKLPGRAEYDNLQLSRALSADGWKQTCAWLRKVRNSADQSYDSQGQITLLDACGKEVATWTLRNVYPVSWTGPDLDASKSSVALEKLELAHEGFLDQ